MPIPVYSTVFITNPALDGEASYEILAGYTAVVRDIDVVWDGPDPIVGPAAWAYDTIGTQFWGVYETEITDLFVTWSWRGRQVIPGPGFVYLSTDNTANARMSGYLLEGTAP
jgi:hypothetical protein